MKKLLRYANLIALVAGIVGMLLVFWLYAGGTNEQGLYPGHHAGWIMAGIVTTAFVIFAWFLANRAGNSRSYRQNFPFSTAAIIGNAVAAISLLLSGYQALSMGKLLGLLSGALGILGGIAMIWAAVCRLRGLRNTLPVHMFPCLYFALQLFVVGQQYGSEPEMCRYLYRFWATICMVPACYWLWSFDVGMGKRTNCLFWCLVAGYCNLVAAAGNSQWLMHLSMAAWMLTALPHLRYLPKLPRTVTEAAPVAQKAAVAEMPAEETPVFTDAAGTVTPAEAATEEPVPQMPDADMPDPESILEQLLRDFGQQGEH